MAIIYLILGVIIGAIITFLLIKNKTTQEVSKTSATGKSPYPSALIVTWSEWLPM